MLRAGNFKCSPDDSNVPSMLATSALRNKFSQAQKWHSHSSEGPEGSKKEEGDAEAAGDLPGTTWQLTGYLVLPTELPSVKIEHYGHFSGLPVTGS